MPPRRAAQMCRPYGGCRSGYFFLVGAGPRPARRDSHRARWLDKARCGTETAVLEIFFPPRAQRRFGDSAAAGKVTRRHLRAKCRRFAAVALRNAPAGASRRRNSPTPLQKTRKLYLCRIKKIHLKSRKKLTRMWERSLTIGGESGIVDSANENNSC